tara:strand:+ start:1695 stop:1967 length:273 start_codon:yes stop_codon:yes gene_type:complete
MIETRKEFISRVLWMIKEIDKSKFKSLDILSMIDFQLKQREVDLMKKDRDIMISLIDKSLNNLSIYNRQTKAKISTKVEVEFNKLIEEDK